VIHQRFEIDHQPPVRSIVDDFGKRSDQVGTLERWMSEGKRDNVTPG
jgi:hypothetical protein